MHGVAEPAGHDGACSRPARQRRVVDVQRSHVGPQRRGVPQLSALRQEALAQRGVPVVLHRILCAPRDVLQHAAEEAHSLLRLRYPAVDTSTSSVTMSSMTIWKQVKSNINHGADLWTVSVMSPKLLLR